MEGIIVACLITYSGWAISPNQEWYRTTSVANCQKEAQTKHFGLVSTWTVYNMNNPRDVFDYQVRCGKDGKDCIKGE